MATVKEIIESTYTKVNGEYEAQVESSEDFKTYLNVLNQTMGIWAKTPYVKWQSLFDIDYTLPDPVEADKFAYAIPDANRLEVANSPRDHVFFVDANNEVVGEYKMVDQALFQSTSDSAVACFLGEELHLKKVAEQIVGAKIVLPAYLCPQKYTSGAEVVKIDSVPWLVASMAAFLCSSSPVPFIARNADRYEKEASVLMKQMKANNRHSQKHAIKSPTATVKRENIVDSLTFKDL